MIDKPIPMQRAAAIRFVLPDQTEVSLGPISIDQARACVRLDPDEGQTRLAAMAARLTAAGYVVAAPENPLADVAPPESDRERILRLHRQAEILFGPENHYLLDKLTLHQVAEVISTLFIAAAGMDPQMYAAWQVSQRQIDRGLGAIDSLRRLDALTVELAAQLRRLPSEVGATALADAVALQSQLAEAAQTEAKFAAALHGKQLQ